jgi:FtsH-binding integral membrane protein
MAIWNDPQPRSGYGASSRVNGGFAGAAGDVDAGLRSYMLSIYNYMASGVLLSGLVALLFVRSGMAEVAMHSPLRLVLAFAPLVFVMVMSFGINRIAAATLQMLFWAFCVTMGLSLSSILLVYTGDSIAATFFATAGAFAGLSFVGYTTKKNLSAMGGFMVMGLFGLLIAMVVNMFMHSGPLQLAISGLGVLIFAGLTAWDTQRLKAMYYQTAGSAWAEKTVIMGALTLYLDFINMFLFLLRFMGNQRR